MPNILFIGISRKVADAIIENLIRSLPDDMDDAVYDVFKRAPRYAKTGKPAPYVIIRDSEREQAMKLKDAIKDLYKFMGNLDFEIDIIEFFPGDDVPQYAFAP